MENVSVHKTAVVHPSAKLGPGVTVGPYSIIEGDVTIGDNTTIGAHCVIEGNTTLGKGNTLYTGAVLGSHPQNKHSKTDENVFLTVGDNNIFREYVMINPGTREGGDKTVIGSNNLLMAYSHVAHDCIIGNDCTLANYTGLAGHVTVEDRVVTGGLTGIHQFTRLGQMSIVGGCSRVVQDIPPFSTCSGHPAKVYGINAVGLKRANIPSGTIKAVKRAIRILFFSGLSRPNAIEKIEQEVAMCPEIEHLIFFVKTSERGVCSAASAAQKQEE